MTLIVAAPMNIKCALCVDVIEKGRPYFLYDDKPAHPECIPSPQPWETHAPPSVEKLSEHLQARDELARTLIDNNLDINSLPPEISDQIVLVMMAESELWGLVQAVMEEHSG